MARCGCKLVIPYWPSDDRPAAFSSWDQGGACGCSGTDGSGVVEVSVEASASVSFEIVEGVSEMGGVIEAVRRLVAPLVAGYPFVLQEIVSDR